MLPRKERRDRGFLFTYICLIGKVSEDRRHDDDVSERDPSGASRPAEVFVTVYGHVYRPQMSVVFPLSRASWRWGGGGRGRFAEWDWRRTIVSHVGRIVRKSWDQG